MSKGDSAVIKEIRAKFTADLSDYNKAIKEAQATTDAVRKKMEAVGAALEKATGAPAKEMSQWQRELKSTETALNSVDRRVKTLITSQRQLERSISTSTAQLAQQRQEYQATQDKLSQVTSVYSTIKDATAGIDLSTPIQEQLEKVSNLMDQYEVQIEDLRQSIASATKTGYSVQLDSGTIVSLDEAKQKMNELIAETDRAGEEYQRLAEAIGKIGQENIGQASESGMKQMEAEIDKLQSQLTNLGTKSTQTADKIATDAEKYQSASGELQQLQDKVNSLSANMDKIDSAASKAGSSVNTSFSGVKSKMESAHTAIQKVSPAISKIGSAAAKPVQAVGRLAGKLAELAKNKVVNGIKSVCSHIKNIGRHSKSSTASLTKMVRQIRNIGVVSMGLRLTSAIFGRLRSIVNEYISSNEEASAAVSELKTAFSNALAPAINVIINLFLKLLPYIEAAANAFTELINRIFGANWTTLSSDISSSADAVEDVADAQEQLDLEGFDEINKLSDNSSSSSSSDSGTSTTSATNPDSLGWNFDSWGEAFDSFVDWLTQKGVPLLQKGLDKVKQLGEDVANAFNNFVNEIDWATLGGALGAGLNTALNFLTSLIYSFDWKNLGAKLAEALNNLIYEVDWANLGKMIWAKFKIIFETIAGFLENLDMPAVAEAASSIVIGLFDSMIETIENIDWKKIGTQIKTLITNIDWKGIANSAAKSANAIVQAFRDLDLGSSIGEIINGFFSYAIEFAGTFDWKNLGTTISEAINNFLTTTDWKSVGKGISDFVKGFLDAVIAFFQDLDWGQLGRSIIDLILGIDWLGLAWKLIQVGASLIAGIWEGITSAWNELLTTFGDWLYDTMIEPMKEGWQQIKNYFSGLWSETVDGLVEMGEWFADAFQQAKELVVKVWGTVTDFFSKLWEGIKNVFGDVAGWFSDKFTAAKQGISNAWSSVTGFFSGVWGGIKNAFSDVKGWFGDKFQGAKDKIVDIFTSLKKKLSDIWDGIKNVMKTPINGILSFINSLMSGVTSGVNAVIRALNRINVTIPSWVPVIGGGSFGFNIQELTAPQIPLLAQGAVIPANDPFPAVLGDQKSGNNIEAPESLLRQIVREESGGEVTIHVPVELDGRTLTDIVKTILLQEARQGLNPLSGVV